MKLKKDLHRTTRLTARISLLIAVVVMIIATTSCTTTRYYVVRHAEKQDNTDDSPLRNPEGFERARALATRLAAKNISRIYVSDKLRTQQTAAPTATEFGITPMIIPKVDVQLLINTLKRVNKSNVLVIWHSDELHTIVNSLVPTSQQISQIGNEFSNLFIIKRRVILWNTRTSLIKDHYGAPDN